MKNTIIQPYTIEPRRSIDLTVSENPQGCSPVVLRAIKNLKINPSIYPNTNGKPLRQALASFLNCEPTTIFVANGSESIIRDIPRILVQPGDEVLIPQLTFPLFAQYSGLARLFIKLVPMQLDLSIDLDKVVATINSKTKMIILCNPNNPTGMTLEREQIIDFLDQVPKSILVIVDEANIDFGGQSVIDQALRRPNLIVLRSFSKGFGLAGFRIGFAVGNEKLIQELITNTPPFPITSLSEQLAITALTDFDFVKKSKLVMNLERKKIKQQLTNLGCTVFDSQANNVLAKLPELITPQMFYKRLADNDISVVKGSRFIGCDDSYFRVSPRDAKTNDLFLLKIAMILDSNNNK